MKKINLGLAISGLAVSVGTVYFLCLWVVALLGSSYLGADGIQLLLITLVCTAIVIIFWVMYQKSELGEPFVKKQLTETPPEIEELVREVSLQGNIKNIKVYIVKDDTVNAYTTGDKIYLTEGAIQLAPGQLKAIVAHELGHIVLNHVKWQELLWLFGAKIVDIGTGWIAGSAANPAKSFGGGRNPNTATGNNWVNILKGIIGGFFVFSGSISSWFSGPLMKDHEYAADAFAVNLGYGNELSSVLCFMRSNPPAPKRIKRIERLMGKSKKQQELQEEIAVKAPEPTVKPEVSLNYTSSLIRDLVLEACKQVKNIHVEDTHIQMGTPSVDVEIKVGASTGFTAATCAVEKEVRELLQEKVGAFEVRATVTGLLHQEPKQKPQLLADEPPVGQTGPSLEAEYNNY